ncbi:hypothetical protein [Sulfuricurvum sp.]|uniref:hypothetical protein n=1 Tax=Sulfuricurvum sp. TaxID=2025608 RepID=UPI003568036B
MKTVTLILMAVQLSFGAWWNYTNIDSLRMRKFANDKLMFVDAADSTLDSTQIGYNKINHYTTFPSYLLYDSSSNGMLAVNTSNGFDNKILTLSSAGAGGFMNRGSFIALYGNEATIPGAIHIASGEAGYTKLFTPFFYIAFGSDTANLNIVPWPGTGTNSTAIGCSDLRPEAHLNIFGNTIGDGFDLYSDTALAVSLLIANENFQVGASGHQIFEVTRHIDTVFIDFGDTTLFIKCGIVP